MSAHHPMGPSRWPLRRACPGSLAAELPSWERPDDPDADCDAGKSRHAAAAAGLAFREARPTELAKLPVDDHALVESYWKYWDILIACGPGRILDAGVEDRVECHGNRFGSCDSWMLTERRDGTKCLWVADLKGQSPGRARYSLQLADYADGIMRNRIARGLAKDGGNWAVTVAYISRAGIDEHQYADGELAERVGEMLRIRAACEAPDAPRIPGDHCGHCRAAATCEARQTVALRSAGLVEVLRDPVAWLMSMAPPDRTAALDRVCAAAAKLDEVEKAIKAEIREGRLEVEKYRAIQQTRAAWRDGVTRQDVLALAADEAQRDALAPLCSPSQAAQIVGKNAVDKLTERKPGTPSVRRMK